MLSTLHSTPHRVFATVLAFSSAVFLGGCASGPNRSTINELSVASEAAPPPLPQQADLAQLIQFTLAHHPRMHAATADVRAAEAEAISAGALMDPSLSVSQSIAGEEAQTIALQQNVPLFGQRGLARQRADYMAQAMAAQRDRVRLEVTQSLIDAYAEYAYILVAIEVLMEQEQLVQQLVQVVGTRYQTGGTQQASLLRMQNEVDKLARQRQDLNDLAEAAGTNLNAALGRPLQESLPPIDLQGARLTKLPDNLEKRLLTANPELRSAAHQLQADEVGRRLAGRAGLPDLMVGIEHMRTPAMGSNRTNLMAGITLPVWRTNYRAQRDRAEALYQASEQRLQNQQLQLTAQLKMAQYRLQEAQRRRQLYGDVLQVRARQAFTSTRTAYQSGAASFADLVASQREWLAYSLGHVRAQADTLRAGAQLLALVDLDLFEQVAGGGDE